MVDRGPVLDFCQKKIMASHNFGNSIDHCLFFSSNFGEPQFFFSFLPYIFGNSVAIILSSSSSFFSHNSFFSFFWAGILIITSPKFNCISLSPSIALFLSPLSYFFLEFWQYHYWNLLFSSLFFQINLNIYLTKRLPRSFLLQSPNTSFYKTRTNSLDT